MNFEKARLSEAEADHEVQGDRKYRGKDREKTTDTRGKSKVMLQDTTRKCKQGRELRGKKDLEWNTDVIEMKKVENLICQATQGPYCDSDVDSTGNRRDAAVAVHRRGC